MFVTLQGVVRVFPSPPPRYERESGHARGTFVGTARASRDKILGLLAALATVLILLLAAQPARAEPNDFLVNRTTNEPDANLSDTPNACDVNTATAGNQCTLRAAIQEANATTNVDGPDEISFAIPSDKKKVKTFKPASELPALTQAVTTDGYTQPGSKKNTRAKGPSTRSSRVSSTVAGLAPMRMR